MCREIQQYLDVLPKEVVTEQLLDPVQFKWDDYHEQAMDLSDDLDDDDGKFETSDTDRGKATPAARESDEESAI